MDRSLKQRLIGAAVLVALAVVFLPMLIKSPAPVSGAADVSLDVPAPPKDGFETRELPLGGPRDVPATGVTGMSGTVEPVATGDQIETTPAPAAQSPATAAGDYAVNFGSYASSADADRIVKALSGLQLTSYAEPTTVAGKSAWRVRIGPFATRADAETARVKALNLGNNARATVIVLDADAAIASTPAAATPAKVNTSALPPSPPAPSAANVAAASKPVEAAAKPEPKPEPKPKPEPAAKPDPAPIAKAPEPAAKPAAAATGFAVQLGAFSKAEDATALRDKARAAGFSAITESVRTSNGTLTRVRLGPVADRAAADRLRADANAKLGINGMVRPHP